MSPAVYIIAGPNGAGKTSFAEEFLPLYIDSKRFVNPDLIAKGLSPFAPEAEAFQAGRLVIQQIRSYIHRRDDFSFESTLSGRGHLALIQLAKEHGYIVRISYIWVSSTALSLLRIQKRFAEGGHTVPKDDVIRRYGKSIRNFLVHYRPLADSWAMFDNSEEGFREIAYQEEGETRMIDVGLYEELTSRYGTP
ncbi:MAG TPA: zeta toxin family protein [Candidatus Acidoferrales bacterium]|nr:zeta toxin family protein [Candidatus Acidoferrales bacterium]